jgi:hypothetical protein
VKGRDEERKGRSIGAGFYCYFYEVPSRICLGNCDDYVGGSERREERDYSESKEKEELFL